MQQFRCQEEEKMTNLKKFNDILALVVSGAKAVVALAEIWNKVGPDVKKVLHPVFEGCKKLAASSNSKTNELLVIEQK